MTMTLETASPSSEAVPTGSDCGLYCETHAADLQSKLLNPETSFALAQWQIQAVKGPPTESAFLAPHLDWLKQDMMLLRCEEDGDLTYVHYGSRIARHAGFTMVGRKVSQFQGVLGDFFRKTYADVIRSGRPRATVHRLGHFRERPMWERVILPLSDGERIASLYVINRVRDLGREFQAFNARSRGNGLIALQFVRSPTGEVVDAVIVGVNQEAGDLTGRRLDQLLNRPMVDCFPGVIEAGLWDRYMAVAETQEPQRFHLKYNRDGIRDSFDVLVRPFLDGVSIDFAPCKSI
jgi:hypothetical protein